MKRKTEKNSLAAISASTVKKQTKNVIKNTNLLSNNNLDMNNIYNR